MAPYVGNTTSNQFYINKKENSLNKTKIEKDAWFNSSKKKDFSFNENPVQIIASFNHVINIFLF